MDQNENDPILSFAMETIQTALEGYIETCLEDEEEYKQERKDLDDAWGILKEFISAADQLIAEYNLIAATRGIGND